MTRLWAEEEFVHDPSRLFIFDNRLFGYASGSNGIPIQGFELTLADKSAKHSLPVFENNIPDWIGKIQVWNQTNELDAPAVYDGGRFLFYTAYDETDNEDLAYSIQDAIGGEYLIKW